MARPGRGAPPPSPGLFGAAIGDVTLVAGMTAGTMAVNRVVELGGSMGAAALLAGTEVLVGAIMAGNLLPAGAGPAALVSLGLTTGGVASLVDLFLRGVGFSQRALAVSHQPQY